MAKILDIYKEKQNIVEQAVKQNMLPLSDLERVQELRYRIGVIEALRIYCLTAPVTENLEILLKHFNQVFDCLSGLAKEHLVKDSKDEAINNARKTAKAALDDSYIGMANVFGHFKATNQNSYKEQIIKVINGFIPVWLQYRDSLIPIKISTEEKHDRR